MPECRERLRRAFEAQRCAHISDRLDRAIAQRLAHAGIGLGAYYAGQLQQAIRARDVAIAQCALDTGELPEPPSEEPAPLSARSSSPTLRLV